MSCTCTPVNNIRRLWSTVRARSRRLDCRGSAIILVISIGTLITLLASLWISFSVHRGRAIVDKRRSLHARYATESAVSKAIYEWTLQKQDSAKADSMKHFGVIVAHAPLSDTGDTMGGDGVSVTYDDSAHGSRATATVEEDGSFLLVKASGESGSAACEIDARFGSEPPEDFRYALIVSDHTGALDVARGRIIGDVKASLQPQGLIDGKVEVGMISELPRVNETAFKTALDSLESKIRFSEKAETALLGSQVFKGKPPPLSEETGLFVNGNLLIESDGSRPLVVRGPGTIISTGIVQISGETTVEDAQILALGNVNCFDNVRLENVTVYSQNTIYLHDRVRCNGNLYAYSAVSLDGESSVTMPGFVYIKSAVSADPKGVRGVQLMERSRFSGVVFCNDNTVSLIGRDARFTGIFYTKGNLQLEGVVFGCVAAVKLVADFEGRRNVVAGGTINRKLLPKNFVVPCAFNTGKSRYRLVTWSEKMGKRKS